MAIIDRTADLAVDLTAELNARDFRTASVQCLAMEDGELVEMLVGLSQYAENLAVKHGAGRTSLGNTCRMVRPAVGAFASRHAPDEFDHAVDLMYGADGEGGAA